MRFKDANECLTAGVTALVLLACLEAGATEVLRPDAFGNIYDFEEGIWDQFYPPAHKLGLPLPWGNSHGSSLPFRFRYGEVTVWSGYNKHGKSEVLNHVMVDLCWQGERVLICSLEIPAVVTYHKLIRMAMGTGYVCAPEDRAQFRERCLKPLAERVWVYDQTRGNARLEDVFNVMLYAFQRHGVRQFVLDSMMCFDNLEGEGQEMWTQQKHFMDELVTFARKYGVHLHLVAHSKKPGRGGDAVIPKRYDVMGSAYISNKPNNVIIVWRNRAKQDALETVFQKCDDLWRDQNPGERKLPFRRLQGGPPPKSRPDLRVIWERMIAIVECLPPEEKEIFTKQIQEHDAYFIVDAQRGGDGDCPARHLWFHVDSLQFLEASAWRVQDARSRPRVYAGTAVKTEEEEPPL